jgi:hypothetical protein
MTRLTFPVVDKVIRVLCLAHLSAGKSIRCQELARMCREICYWNGACLEELQAGVEYMETEQAPKTRPMLLVRDGDDCSPTLWLLGWRACDATPIHDHDDSEAAIHVYRGSIREDLYPQLPSVGGQRRYHKRAIVRDFVEGTILTMQAPYVHVIRNNGDYKGPLAITLHAYYPKLDRMNFYAAKDAQLVVSDHWEA